MKRDKSINKSTLWTGSIAAAFVAAVAIFAAMLQIEKSVLSGYAKDGIYVASKTIPRGQIITQENYEDYLVRKELDVSCIPDTAIGSEGQIEGLVSKIDIEPGVLLTQGMFCELDTITEHMKEPVIAGFKAEDLYQVVGGVLRTGDYVHIYVVSGEGDARLVWKNVFVYQVFDGAGNIISNEENTVSAQRINVYLDRKDVERFYSELSKGSLRVVKVE